MHVKKIPMTVCGEAQLREEYLTLKSEARPKVIKAISEARRHGDLKENAEYHAAKEQQSFVEGRIREIEAKLSQAEVIDVASMPQRDRVIFGATVTFRHLDNDETFTYQIVGADEVDIAENKISFDSPLAKAAMSKGVNEVVEVLVPNDNTIRYEICAIAYL